MVIFHRSRAATFAVSVYLLLVMAACSPLLKDLAIHHGNGIAFLAATVLTSPLSWAFLWVVDQLTTVNAFYVSGWFFAMYMAIFIFCALINATVIVYLVSGPRKMSLPE